MHSDGVGPPERVRGRKLLPHSTEELQRILHATFDPRVQLTCVHLK